MEQKQTVRDEYCPVTDCPGNRVKGPKCCYYEYGLPCRHPAHRDEWQARRAVTHNDAEVNDAEVNGAEVNGAEVKVNEQ